MANPFPGVDPFLEVTDLWVGFHNTLIGDFGKLLNPALIPRGYVAIVEKRVDLVDPPVRRSEDRRPDLMVTAGSGTRGQSPVRSAVAVMEVETARVTLPTYESVPVAYISIRSLPDREVVTAIELLSPSNKTGTSRGEYMGNRASILSSDINLVEIDLLLVGRRPEVIGDIPPGDFCALISRGGLRPNCDASAWSIRRSLPRLGIPLRTGEDDVVLELAAAYAMTYEGGAYDMIIPYEKPLAGPLSDADREWVAERLEARAGGTPRGA